MIGIKKEIKYVFRGSTVNWLGNLASQAIPITPTTTHPVKALLFALCCSDKGSPAVIYVASVQNLKGINIAKNVLAKVEDEIGYMIAPEAYIDLCDGYILLEDAIKIIRDLDINPPPLYDRTMLDMALKDIPPVNAALIEQFYTLAEPFLRRNP